MSEDPKQIRNQPSNADQVLGGHFEQVGSRAELEATLDYVAGADAIAEKKKSRWGWGIFLGIVAFIAAAVVIPTDEPLFPIALLVCGLWFVLSIAMRSMAGKQDFVNERYALVERILHLLSGELHKSAPLQLKLDLRPLESDFNISRAQVVGPWKTVEKSGIWTHTYYDDPWLTLAGRFCDDSQFELRVTDHQLERKGWKTNARGKTKRKRKTKLAFTLSLSLKVPEARYGSLSALGTQAELALQVPEGLRKKTKLRVQGQRMLVRIICLGGWGANRLSAIEDPVNQQVVNFARITPTDAVPVVAQLFLSAYQVLNYARTQRQKPAA